MTQFSLYQGYIKQRRPSGSTQSWQTVLPMEISYTDGSGHTTVIEQDSTHCGYVPPVEPQYRWVNVPINQDYECDTTTYTKYYRQKKQVSYNNGATWNDVSPAEYQRGGVYESQSIDCGYVVPTGYKWTATYTDGSELNAPCSDDTTMRGTECGEIASERNLVNLHVGDCVETISSVGGMLPPSKYLRTVTLGNNVSRISGAFRYCDSLNDVTLPDSLKRVEDSFCYCNSFTSLRIPHSVTYIDIYSFIGSSSITSITVDNGNTKYDSRGGCNAIVDTNSNTLMVGCVNTVIPNSVTSIGHAAFSNCSGLTSITIPSSVTSISGGAFSYCSSLTSITIPNSVTSIGNGAFVQCSGLTSITLPDNITSIESLMLDECFRLTNVAIPNSVTSIGDAAFQLCSGLTSITIPSGVTSIGESAFYGCSSLTSITCLATTPPTLGGSSLATHSNFSIYVPSSSVNAYKRASVWSTYASRIFPIGS